MNGHANCIYAICCPPNSPQQISALAEEMMAAGLGLTEESTYAVAAWVLKNFDLAPHGSLQPFKNEIARLAREPRDNKGDGSDGRG